MYSTGSNPFKVSKRETIKRYTKYFTGFKPSRVDKRLLSIVSVSIKSVKNTLNNQSKPLPLIRSKGGSFIEELFALYKANAKDTYEKRSFAFTAVKDSVDV